MSKSERKQTMPAGSAFSYLLCGGCADLAELWSARYRNIRSFCIFWKFRGILDTAGACRRMNEPGIKRPDRTKPGQGRRHCGSIPYIERICDYGNRFQYKQNKRDFDAGVCRREPGAEPLYNRGFLRKKERPCRCGGSLPLHSRSGAGTCGDFLQPSCLAGVNHNCHRRDLSGRSVQ